MRTKFLFLLFTIFCFSCLNAQDVIIPLQPDTTNKVAIARNNLPSSQIDIPIVLDLKPIYKFADQMVDTLFTSPNYPKSWEMEGCDLRYQYHFKRGPLRFRTNGDKLMVSFTGFYGIRGSTRICTAGGTSPWTPACTCGFGKEAPRKVDAGFVMQFKLQPDYSLQVNSIVVNPVPADKCEVCFFGRDVTQKIVDRVKEEVQLSVDELKQTIAGINIRSYMQMAWDSLQNGYRVPGIGYLNINPEALRFSSIDTRNDSLFISIGLSATPELKPDPQLLKRPLPNLKDFSQRKGFNFYIAELLPYDSLNALVNANIAGKEFQVGKGLIKKTIRIDSVSLKGGEEKVFVKVGVSKSARGFFYLEGKPAWDPVTQKIFLDDLDFHMQSKQLLLKAANYLLDDFIISKIRAYTTFDLDDQENGMLKSATEQINRTLYPGVKSVGTLKKMNLHQITGASDGLFLQGAIEGELKIELDAALLLQQFKF